jgi:hypothetical protein
MAVSNCFGGICSETSPSGRKYIGAFNRKRFPALADNIEAYFSLRYMLATNNDNSGATADGAVRAV